LLGRTDVYVTGSQNLFLCCFPGVRTWLSKRRWGITIIKIHDKVTSEIEDYDGYVFDAFVSYSWQDEEFVIKELTKVLEGGDAPYKLNLHFR
jgi:hypothetical protein